MDFGEYRGMGAAAVASGASITRFTVAGSRRRPGELCGVMGRARPVPIGQVSGTVWQPRGRSKQPITTMMPIRQHGHCRNEIPVRVSYRWR